MACNTTSSDDLFDSARRRASRSGLLSGELFNSGLPTTLAEAEHETDATATDEIRPVRVLLINRRRENVVSSRVSSVWTHVDFEFNGCDIGYRLGAVDMNWNDWHVVKAIATTRAISVEDEDIMVLEVYTSREEPICTCIILYQ